jgi:gamma-glutamylcysteine synthetase
MFKAFGGYFGKMSNSKELSFSKLEEIAKSYREQNKNINNIENDIKTLHSAFLYGISPQQLVKGVKLLVD